MTTTEIDVTIIREVFELDNGRIYWRKRPLNHFSTEAGWKQFNTRCAGSEVKLNRGIHSSINFRIKGVKFNTSINPLKLMLSGNTIDLSYKLIMQIDSIKSEVLNTFYLDNGVVHRIKTGKPAAKNSVTGHYAMGRNHRPGKLIEYILEHKEDIDDI